MKAATCVADITPSCEVHLCGYIGEARKQSAKGVLDTPLAVSVLLEIDNVMLLFVSIDVLLLGGKKAAIIKEKITEVLNIDQDHIILNAIHSHSLANGFGDEVLFDTPDNPQYFAQACDKIVQSIQGLQEQLVEVEATISEGTIHGYYSKRSDRKAPFEDHAAIIKFKHEDTIVAAMCNFNCHATVLGPENMLLSADVIGAVRSQLAKAFGVIPYTFTGASGDISNRQYRQGNDIHELKRVSQGIADCLLRMEHEEALTLAPLEQKSYTYKISYDNTKYYDMYETQLQEANRILQQQNLPLDEWKLRTSEKAILMEKLTKKEIAFHVGGYIWRLGELTIVTFPGELASCFGLQLRRACTNKHFLLIGYANDYQGYFIEASEYGKTYETKASNTPLGESEKITAMIGDLL